MELWLTVLITRCAVIHVDWLVGCGGSHSIKLTMDLGPATLLAQVFFSDLESSLTAALVASICFKRRWKVGGGYANSWPFASIFFLLFSRCLFHFSHTASPSLLHSLKPMSHRISSLSAALCPHTACLTHSHTHTPKHKPGTRMDNIRELNDPYTSPL